MDWFNSGSAHFDFLALRKKAFVLSLIAVVGSLILLVVPGPKYGIDFAGGTNVIVRFTESVTSVDVRAAVLEMGFDDASVQAFGGEGDHQFLIETQAVSAVGAEDKAAMANALVSRFGEGTTADFDESAGDRIYVRLTPEAWAAADAQPIEGQTEVTEAQRGAALSDAADAALATAGFDTPWVEPFGAPSDRQLLVHTQGLQAAFSEGFRATMGDTFLGIDRVETVGPRVGQQLRDDGIKAVLFALVAILIYIAVRFDFRYAPAAVLALFHDVTITLGIFVIIRQEISLPIIAALLTIVGYSLNDTIINFDRVRENLDDDATGKASLYDTVNKSVNEVMSRTILTSFTTILAVSMILIFGGGLIQSFALAMIIGIVIGTYSSIFIANPMMIVTSEYLESRRQAQVVETPATP